MRCPGYRALRRHRPQRHTAAAGARAPDRLRYLDAANGHLPRRSEHYLTGPSSEPGRPVVFSQRAETSGQLAGEVPDTQITRFEANDEVVAGSLGICHPSPGPRSRDAIRFTASPAPAVRSWALQRNSTPRYGGECSHTTMFALGSRRRCTAFTSRLLVTMWKPPSRHSCQTGDKSTVPSCR